MLRSMNLEVLQRKIQELEEDNKVLHTEASKVNEHLYFFTVVAGVKKHRGMTEGSGGGMFLKEKINLNDSS